MAQKAKDSTPDLWRGEERRSYSHRCYDHGKHEERMASHGARIKTIEDSKPVPFVNFKWINGTIVVVLLSMFSAYYYVSSETQKSLIEIRIKQERVITKLDALTFSVKEAKEINAEEIARIYRNMDKIIKEVLNGTTSTHPMP